VIKFVKQLFNMKVKSMQFGYLFLILLFG